MNFFDDFRDAEQGLLHRVLHVLLPVEDGLGRPVQGQLVLLNQGHKGVFIAPLGLAHQSLHNILPSSCGRFPQFSQFPMD